MVEAYKMVMDQYFIDGSYSLSRACLFWEFTRQVMEMEPEVADEIDQLYHKLLFDHYPALYLISVLLH